ncbi:hypothetical protein OG923_14430 [Streptomyces halstedii]|uniref:hypothetical protein n=1 Tax=Streptomyces halstedii TaxID=1944 RepID=UPI0032556AFC
MIRVKSLMQNANPSSETKAAEELPARASDELTRLVGPAPATPPSTPGRRPSRRGPVMVAAIACGAAVAFGVFLASGGDGPASGPTTAASSGPGTEEGGQSAADEPYFATARELEDAADLVVLARVGSSGLDEANTSSPEAVATAEVLATAKGSATDRPGKSIKIAYTVPGTGPETAELSAGATYVFFLERQDNGQLTLVSTTQGFYSVEGSRAVPGPDNDVLMSALVHQALGLSG